MPYATALSVTVPNTLPMVHQNALRFYDDIASYNDYGGLVHDGCESERLATALGNCRILFMANHGVVVLGRNAAEAFDTLYYLEQACRVVVTAQSTGQPLRPIDRETCASTKAAMDAELPYYSAVHFAAVCCVCMGGLGGM